MKVAFYVSGKANRLRQIMDRADKNFLETVSFVFSEDESTRYLESLLEPCGIPYYLCDWLSLVGDRNLLLSNQLLELR